MSTMMNVQFPSLLKSCVALSIFVLYLDFFSCEGMNTTTSRTINIGALVAFNTAIGKVAMRAIELAVRDVNNDSSLLHGSQLMVHLFDTNCSGFRGAAAAIELLKEDVVGIVGPQSSTVSHFIAHMGSATQVPLISFGATDPALAEFQYPFFFRVIHNDKMQMAAVAAVIGYYKWKKVIVLYSDDDYGTNGIIALDNLLGSLIIHKEPIPPGIDRSTIGSVLIQMAMMESRVFVVHMQQDVGLELFYEANYLGMMNSGYAWIVTDAIAVSLDALYLRFDALKSTQGIIGTRRYIPETPQLYSYLAEREQLQGQELESNQPNAYELSAYDSVWVLAHAIDHYLKEGLQFKFEDPPTLPRDAGGSSELSQLKIFPGGSLLRHEILQTTFNGTTGYIKLDEKGDLVDPAFEIVNMVGKGLHVIGYWTCATGISRSSPNVTNQSLNTSIPIAQLQDAIWPGGTSQIPRGWVVPQNGNPLRIGVPRKTGFKEIVNIMNNSDNSTTFQGFCIDVFETALKYLPYYVPYNFVAVGNGNMTPNYDNLIERLKNKEFDAIVGDTTITMRRLELVDFTQHFKEAGLVIVAPLTSARTENQWDFLQPFTYTMWCISGAFFIFTGMIIWTLEHKMNIDFRGHPKKQIVTSLWFIFSTLFFSQSERTKTTLGRVVLLLWLFVVLIITSSYTASLTSILTVQHLIPSIQDINNLISSEISVGYQTGSFVKDYLISLGINGTRLKNYSSVERYAEALKLGPYNGGVGAIVDDLPYAQLFTSLKCNYQIVGQPFTINEWGFAFPKGSQLTEDMSAAILSMSANGDIHRIYNLWFSEGQCSSENNQVEWAQLDVISFWGLFLITGLVSIVSLAIYIVRLVVEYKSRLGGNISSEERSSSRVPSQMKDFFSFVDEAAPSKKNGRKKKRKHNELANRLDQTLAV